MWSGKAKQLDCGTVSPFLSKSSQAEGRAGSLTLYKIVACEQALRWPLGTRGGPPQAPRAQGAGVIGIPRKYVFGVVSVGQRSSPWPCKLGKVEIIFRLDCKLHFPSA